MTDGSTNRVVRDLCQSMLRHEGESLTDAQLVGHFVDRRDPAAFEALVNRHGPMVLSVCRRLLGNHHDAEDAFQATFLVLARKAGSIKPREMAPNWLYGVAYQPYPRRYGHPRSSRQPCSPRAVPSRPVRARPA